MELAEPASMRVASPFSVYRLTAIAVVMCCLLSLAEGLIPQLEMTVFGGRVLVSNAVIKVFLLGLALFGCLLKPSLELFELPKVIWIVCLGYLVIDSAYLVLERGVPISDLLLSYNSYYLILFVGIMLVEFRGVVQERTVVLAIGCLLAVCAPVALLQHFLSTPLLHTESKDGSFLIMDWNFFGETRAFSFFNSALNLGIFSAWCGSLGVALFRTKRVKGFLIFFVSALTCYATLTRLCYVIFACASVQAGILTFGKKPTRGKWQPIVYFALGVATILAGLSMFFGDTTDFQNASSLINRMDEWTYYLDVIFRAPFADKLLGMGVFQSGKADKLLPLVIDSTPLALVLHIGVVGLILFSLLILKMLIYLRKEAINTGNTVFIAAASLWSTILCAGTFNIIFSLYGAVFAISILTSRSPVEEYGTATLRRRT